jgi:hypothetical protein
VVLKLAGHGKCGSRFVGDARILFHWKLGQQFRQRRSWCICRQFLRLTVELKDAFIGDLVGAFVDDVVGPFEGDFDGELFS